MTNYAQVAVLQATMPHTFNSLQKLVRAMAKFQKHRGKRPIFGRDKSRKAWEVVLQELKKTLTSMSMDGMIDYSGPPDEAREKLVECLREFEAAFPNWQDAYWFAVEFFVEGKVIANDVIKSLRG